MLLAATPDGLLPVVCYLCQGLIAPEFAGVDLGLAEKLAVRAVATATGASPAEVTALVRETGDLGLAAEQLLAATAAGRPASLTVPSVVDTLHQIAAAEGPGSQGRKLDLLAGLLGQATPLEARYLLRLVTKGLRLGIGTPTILDALAQVLYRRAGRPAGAGTRLQHLLRPGPGRRRADRVAAWRRSGSSTCARATRCGPCWPSGWPRRRGDPGQAGRPVRGRVQVRRRPGPGAPHRRRGRSSCSPGGWSACPHQFPDVVERPSPPGWGPARRSSKGRSSRTTRPPGNCARSQEVMFRRRKHGIDQAVLDVPVGLFCFELLYADGEDLTRLPYPQRRAALAAALTVRHRLRLTTATEVGAPAALDAAFEQAVTDGCEGLVCKSIGPGLGLPGRRARLAVDQAQAGLPHRAVRHRRPGRRRRVRRARPPRRRVRRAAAGRLRRRPPTCSAP